MGTVYSPVSIWRPLGLIRDTTFILPRGSYKDDTPTSIYTDIFSQKYTITFNVTSRVSNFSTSIYGPKRRVQPIHGEKN